MKNEQKYSIFVQYIDFTELDGDGSSEIGVMYHLKNVRQKMKKKCKACHLLF